APAIDDITFGFALAGPHHDPAHQRNVDAAAEPQRALRLRQPMHGAGAQAGRGPWCHVAWAAQSGDESLSVRRGTVLLIDNDDFMTVARQLVSSRDAGHAGAENQNFHPSP